MEPGREAKTTTGAASGAKAEAGREAGLGRHALQPGEPVCVTGASGYIGSWVAKLCLDAGHPVHATVRDPQATEKVAHLRRDAEQAGTEMRLFAADLTRPGSFAEAIAGCACVFHVASPFILPDRVKDAEQDLLAPAVAGTENVLAAVARADSVRRVVLTASVASMYGDNADLRGRSLTSADWNRTSTNAHQPYSLSKTLAERKAWELAQAQRRWDLVTIHPGFVLGPSRSRRIDGASITLLLEMIRGKYKQGFPALHFGLVDVRDVAATHLAAARRPQAEGRYICVGDSMSLVDVAGRLRRLSDGRYPDLPQRAIPKPLLYVAGPFIGFSWKYIHRNVGIPIEFDVRRTREDLEIEFRPVDEMLRDFLGQFEADRLI